MDRGFFKLFTSPDKKLGRVSLMTGILTLAFILAYDNSPSTLPPQATQPPTYTPLATNPANTPTITPELPTAITETLRPQKKVLVIGDSLVAIRDDGFSTINYVEALANTLGPGYIMLEHEGHGGFTSRKIADDLKEEQLTGNGHWGDYNVEFPIELENKIPDILVIRLGTNDVGSSGNGKDDPGIDLNQSKENIKFIIDFFESLNPNIAVAIDSVPFLQYRGDIAKLNLRRQQLLDLEIQLANELNATGNYQIYVVNQQNSITANELMPDTVHPNSTGVQIMVDNIASMIKSIP